jgi:hypothetical protein
LKIFNHSIKKVFEIVLKNVDRPKSFQQSAGKLELA